MLKEMLLVVQWNIFFLLIIILHLKDCLANKNNLVVSPHKIPHHFFITNLTYEYAIAFVLTLVF